MLVAATFVATTAAPVLRGIRFVLRLRMRRRL
jgi:hypothetical protein